MPIRAALWALLISLAFSSGCQQPQARQPAPAPPPAPSSAEAPSAVRSPSAAFILEDRGTFFGNRNGPSTSEFFR